MIQTKEKQVDEIMELAYSVNSIIMKGGSYVTAKNIGYLEETTDKIIMKVKEVLADNEILDSVVDKDGFIDDMRTILDISERNKVTIENYIKQLR